MSDLPSIVQIRCSKNGCPRKRMIPTDECMPRGTVLVVQPCPWHEESGTKNDGAFYFNSLGEEIIWSNL